MLLPLPVYAQSVADTARENREAKAAQDATGIKPKIITNQDLGESPEGKPKLGLQPRSRIAASSTDTHISANTQHSEQWRKQIKEQETKIANLQARLDQIDAALRAKRNAQGAYNRYQTAQQDKAAQLQLELGEQHKKLEEMEDAVRHSGIGDSVYDR